MEFPGDGVSGSFLRSGLLKRDTCLELPDGGEKGNIARKLLKPLYGLCTACKGRCETIRDFLAKGRGWEVTSVAKSVFCWPRQGFGYGEYFRDTNSPSRDTGILTAGGNFETTE